MLLQPSVVCCVCRESQTEIGEIPSVWVDLWSGSTCCPRPIGPPILPLLGIGWRSINSLLLFKSLSLLLLGQESSTFSVNKGFVYNSLSEQHKNIARFLSCIIIKVWYNQGTKLGFKVQHCIIAAFSLFTGSRSILETNWCCIPVHLGSFWMSNANTKGILCNFAFPFILLLQNQQHLKQEVDDQRAGEECGMWIIDNW